MAMNPFIDSLARQPDLIADAHNARFGRIWQLRHGRTDILAGQGAVSALKDGLLNAHESVLAYTQNGQAVPKHVSDTLEEAGRVFKLAKNQHGYAQGKIVPSIIGAIKEMGAKIGIDTSGIGAGKIRGDVYKAVINTYDTKAGLFERALSKPFRVAANNPVPALILTGLGAVALGGTYFKGRAEKRTQENAMAEAMAAQQAAAQANSYKNSVSPAEAAVLSERMKQAGGHAHAEVARQQDVAANPATVAAL